MRSLHFVVGFFLLTLVATPGRAQERWLDPARDAALAAPGAPHLVPSLLFVRGDTQIAVFRNMDLRGSTRVVTKGATVRQLPRAEVDFSGFRYTAEGKSLSLDDYMRLNHVAGLLVLKDGKIVLERYGLGNRPDHRWVSFSMTKSVVSVLYGAAMADGYIESLDEMVTDYLPRLRGTSYDGVRLRDLLQMASGTQWNEDYADPTSDVASSPGQILGLIQYLGAKERVAAPGSRFNYNTGETNLAGAVLRSAIGNNLSSYLSHRIWAPLGMESDAVWPLHEPGGGELGGCCISATLRDWGRFAAFILADGVLPDGTRVLPPGWIAESIRPSPADAGYGYLWWLQGDGTFRATGIFGQGIYFDPVSNLAIVVQSAWPTATGRVFSEHRSGFYRAVRESLAAGH